MKDRYSLAYYREGVEGELIGFKRGDGTSVLHWLNAIKEEDFSCIGKVDYIVRALGSRETRCNSRTSLDLVGELLAKKLRAKYIRNILSKKRTEQLKFAGNGYNRKAIIHKAYNCDLQSISKNSSFLIIDDVNTTGSTFDEIERAILTASKHQAKISCFSLVRTLWNKDYTTERKVYNDNFYKKLIAS